MNKEEIKILFPDKTDRSNVNILIKQAKKEVFDDLDKNMDKLCKEIGIDNDMNPYEKLKKKHNIKLE